MSIQKRQTALRFLKLGLWVWGRNEPVRMHVVSDGGKRIPLEDSKGIRKKWTPTCRQTGLHFLRNPGFGDGEKISSACEVSVKKFWRRRNPTLITDKIKPHTAAFIVIIQSFSNFLSCRFRALFATVRFYQFSFIFF